MSLPRTFRFSSVRVAEALRVIRSEYAMPQLDLSFVSARLRLSKSYLCRIFRREMRIGLPEYISKVRADAAETLLRETFMSVKEIAAAVGFTYVAQLDRAFKTKCGQSPREYRARIALGDSKGTWSAIFNQR